MELWAPLSSCFRMRECGNRSSNSRSKTYIQRVRCCEEYGGCWSLSSSSQEETALIYGLHVEEHQYQARDMELQKLLQAQLSHPDGIRGFMVAYLTGGSSSASASENTMP